MSRQITALLIALLAVAAVVLWVFSAKQVHKEALARRDAQEFRLIFGADFTDRTMAQEVVNSFFADQLESACTNRRLQHIAKVGHPELEMSLPSGKTIKLTTVYDATWSAQKQRLENADTIARRNGFKSLPDYESFIQLQSQWSPTSKTNNELKCFHG